jgi:hypothetical protein
MELVRVIILGLGLIMMAAVLVGFWRGLSLKPNDPENRAPDRDTWLTRY